MNNKSFAVCVSVAGLVMTGCGSSVSGPEPVRPVRAFKVGDVKAVTTRDYPGKAKAKEEVELSFRVAGPLVTLPVDVGSRVQRGTVIAAIDPRDYQAALDSAEGNLARSRANLLAMERGARPEEIEQLKALVDEAEASYKQALAEFERSANLLPKGAVSRSEYDVHLARRDRSAAQVRKAKEDLNIGQKGARAEDLDAKRAEIRALEAAVANTKNQLEYAVLKAPFDGSVAARYVDNFQTVQAKQSIVRLVDVSKIEVTVQIPENAIALVPRIKTAVCRFDAIPGQEFTGRVTKVGSEASQTTRTYPVTVEIEQSGDAQILPGMAATVRGQPDEDAAAGQGFVIPASSIFTDSSGKQTYVWIVDEGRKKVARRPVKTGAVTATGITVSEGLKVGEWIVTAGGNSLREDQEVKLSKDGT